MRVHVRVSVFVYEDWATRAARLFSEKQARELFLPPPPLPVSSARGARASLSSLQATGRTRRLPSSPVVHSWHLPGAPCERQLRAAPAPAPRHHSSADGWLCFFFSNSCPLLPSCVFRGTSYTTAGHPYLITNFDVNAFTDSPLV